MPELRHNSRADPGASSLLATTVTHRLVVALILVFGVILVAAAFRMVRQYEQLGHQDHFARLAQGPIQEIPLRTRSDLELLRSVAQLCTAKSVVEPSEFRTLVTEPLQRLLEFRQFYWIPRVSATDRVGFETRLGAPLSDFGAEGGRVTTAAAQDYFPVELVHPDQPSLLGMNFASDREAWTAMTNAAALARPVITPRRILEGETQVVCLAFMPVYNASVSSESAQPDRSALRGFVATVISPSRLVSASLTEDSPRLFELQLLDQTALGSEQLLHAEQLDPDSRSEPWSELSELPIHAQRRFEVGQREWAVICRPSPALPLGSRWEPWAVWVGALLVVGLLGGYLYQALTRADQVQRTVALRTRELAAANAQLQAQIAERRKTEAAISRSEARLQAILDNSSAVIYLKDASGRYLLINREFERLFNVHRQDVEGKTDFDLFPKEMAEAFQLNDRRALTEDTALEFEEVAPVEGQRHTYISIKFPLREPHGEVQGVCGISTDITERVRTEQALKDGEALYHSLVECLPLNVVRKDRHGRVTFGNERFCRTLGRPLEELLGKTDFDLFPENLAEKYVADDRRVVETGEVFEDVEEHHSPDNEDRYMHVLKSAVYDAKKQIVGIQVIFWDVTDKHRAEKALQRTMADLSRSNRELEQFAYVASHDLQEPLRMIASYTQLLARRYKDKLDPEAEEFIGFAVDGAVRMQKLINDLLSYSRVGTRGKAFSPTECDPVLQAVLTNLKIAIEESGGQITHDPLPTVQADRTQLTQLLQNLIGNALKFSGDSPPRVHVAAQRDGVNWVFSVRDNGIGIDPQYFERIFVIFQRLHTQQEYTGTGIGLAICKKIIERHGGRIWLESAPGQGTTFYFTLPASIQPIPTPNPV